ncbi:MAG: putative lipopolysaccharide heptosyltransferase III [Limisphaerales bacterium]
MAAAAEEQFARILVIKLKLIGDVLLATPVFQALRLKYPGARLSVCVSRGTEMILDGDPSVDEVFAGTPPRSTGAMGKMRAELELYRKVRAGKFDLVLDLTTSDRSAILTRLSGGRQRIGYESDKGFIGRSRLYTERVQPIRGEHVVRKHCRILKPLGIEVMDPKLSFPLSDQDKRAAEKVLPIGKVFFQVHPVSRVAKKNWPVEFMAETVDRIAARGWVPVITGSNDPQEQAGIAELRRLLKCEHVDVSGALSLKALGALSRRAKFYLGVDTAPMHIAAAVGTPVVVLFGPSSEKLWAPWCERSLVLSRELECRLPCKNKECETIHCLREFTPAMVWPRIEKFLEGLSV